MRKSQKDPELVLTFMVLLEIKKYSIFDKKYSGWNSSLDTIKEDISELENITI